jgi:hypothetical protein
MRQAPRGKACTFDFKFSLIHRNHWAGKYLCKGEEKWNLGKEASATAQYRVTDRNLVPFNKKRDVRESYGSRKSGS